MDEAVLLFVVKDAIFVRPHLNGETATLFIAISRQKGSRLQPQEVGNSFYFILLDKDAPFAVATGSTHLTFESLHDKCLKCLKFEEQKSLFSALRLNHLTTQPINLLTALSSNPQGA